MPLWKKLLIRSAGLGAGFALTLVAALGAWSWYSQRPKPELPWDTSSVKATATDIYTQEGDKFVAMFRYKLSNMTNKDYLMPAAGMRSVMLNLPSGKGYSANEPITIDDAVFIPAHHSVNITVRLSYDYDDSYPFSQRENLSKATTFFGKRLKEQDGFVVFDKVNHYKIELPNANEALK
jgi:hypothetical protein